MFSSLRTKITVPVLGVLALLVVFITVVVAVGVRDFADERSEERITGASQAAHSHLEMLEAYNRMTARAISGLPRLEEFVQSSLDDRLGAMSYLIHYLNDEIKNALGVTYIVITDSDGYVILRTYSPWVFGDSISYLPNIRAALEHDEVSTFYVSTEALQMGLASVAPVWDETDIIGTVTVMTSLGSLHDTAFVDNFGRVFNAAATVFAGDTSIASTLYREPGVRAIGTVAADIVIENVLVDGRPLSLELNLFGAPHVAYYFPLFGWNGAAVGMFFVGFSIAEATEDTNTLLRSIIVIGVAGLILSAIVMLIVISASSRKVSNLAEVVENLTSGENQVDLSVLDTSKDEVGVLTKNVLALVEMIKNLSDILCGMANDSAEKTKEDGGNPIKAAMNNILELQYVIIDKEKHATEALAANRAKSEFLSAMSHEIRTPMNAILGVTEIQLQKPNIDDDMREALEKVYASGDMLLSIINDILDLSKIEAGKMELVVDRYEIASLVSDTAQLNMMRIGGKRIEFEVKIDETMPAYMLGDELRVKQVLNNILSNAFKYTDEGTVKMSVSAKAGAGPEQHILVISVHDTGHGMTKEQVDILFDEYSRFNVQANRSTEGTGLGMSITRNLVQLMNGRIAVESEKGMGSIFTVYIPQGVSGEEQIGRETAENLSNYRTNQRAQMKRVQISRERMPYGKVLIVDDVDTNIYVASGLLAPYELQIEWVNSGFDAIKKIEDGKTYDIIFMDHMMPQMDGIEATKRLRDLGYNEPIVALTANAVAGQADVFINNGFNDFISKPIDLRQLNFVLNRLVRDKQPPEVLESVRNADIEKELNIVNINESSSDYELDPELVAVVKEDFISSQADVIEEIKQAMSDGELVTAQRIAHTLKGAAALLNEHSLVAIADYTEQLFKQGETPDSSHLQTMEDELVTVIEKFKKEVEG